MIKGKILFIVSLLIALVLIAAAAFGGYVGGLATHEALATSLVAYDLSQLPIIFAAVSGVFMLLVTLPTVITARQVCRMYNVSRKYAKWSPVTILVGLLMLLVVGGAIAGVAYLLQSNVIAGLITMGNMMLAQYGYRLDITYLQIGFGAAIFVFGLLLFNPILVALRGRDGVSALLKKKRAHSSEE